MAHDKFRFGQGGIRRIAAPRRPQAQPTVTWSSLFVVGCTLAAFLYIIYRAVGP